MNLNNLWAQAAATKVHLAKMVAGSQGWQVHDVVPPELLGPQIHVYGYDLLAEKAWLGSLNVERFHSLATESQRRPERWADVRGVVGHLMGMLALDTPFDADTRQVLAEANLAPEQALVTFMTAYLGTTQTFAKVAPIPANVHCVVLSYRPNPSAQAGRLRPALMPSTVAGPMPVDRLVAMATQIAERDKKVNPSWFV